MASRKNLISPPLKFHLICNEFINEKKVKNLNCPRTRGKRLHCWVRKIYGSCDISQVSLQSKDAKTDFGRYSAKWICGPHNFKREYYPKGLREVVKIFRKLLLDGTSCHLNISVAKRAEELRIHLFCLSSNTIYEL